MQHILTLIPIAIRLNYGVALRLPRTSKSPLQYKSYTIPPGVAFSMSTYYMSHSEVVFPSSHTFDPSRWLPDPVTGAPALGPDGQKLLTRYLASFSRGTRACLGIQVAYAELYIALATVVRKCEFRLFETTERDVRMWSEKFVAQAHPESKGIRVLVI
jgi:cytochrome P450